MNDENKNADTKTGETHSSGVVLPTEDGGRKINPAPTVHTTGSDGIKLPEGDGDIIDTTTQRFIKTGSTPFVSAHGQTDNSPTDVDKFTDRFAPRSAPQNPHTGYTGKIRTYDDAHSSPDGTKRMIITDLSGSAENVSEDGFSFDIDGLDDSAPEEKTDTVIEDSTSEPEQLSFISEEFADISESENTPAESADAQTGETTTSGKTKKFTSKGDLLREIADSASDDIPHDPDQLMMDGYNTVNDEDKAREEALKDARQKKINNFNFWDSKKKTHKADESTDGRFSSDTEKKKGAFLSGLAEKFENTDASFTPVNCGEFNDPQDRKKIFSQLIKIRKTALIKTFAVLAAGVILLLTDLITAVSASNNSGTFTVFGGSTLAYNIFNCVFLAAVLVILLPDFKKGIVSLLKTTPGADTSITFMMLFTLLQNISMFFVKANVESDLHLLTPAAILLTVPYLMSKVFFYDSARHCFKTASAKSDKSYLRKVSDEKLIKELLRDSEADSSINIVYPGKTRFIRTFLKRTGDSASSAMPDSKAVLISLGASVLIGIIGGIITQSFPAGVTAAALTAILSFPIGSLFACGSAIAKENKSLSSKSSFIQSFSDSADFANIDDVVIDSADIIKAEVTACSCAKGVREKQAMFVAGVLTNSSGGVLKDAFAPAVAGYEDRMPPIDGVICEDRLGVSAWINSCKVLLGTHKLLENHNVKVPSEALAAVMSGSDCKSVYLAMEGQFIALFSVKYSCSASTAANLKTLADNGVNILVSTVDPNLTDKYTEELLSLPHDSVRTLLKKTSDKINNTRMAVTDSEEAGIVFDDTLESMCRCGAASVHLNSVCHMSKLACTCLTSLGAVLSAVLMFTGAFTGITPIVAVILQAIWIAVCIFAPKALAKSEKPRARLPFKKTDDYIDNEGAISDLPPIDENIESEPVIETETPADTTADNVPTIESAPVKEQPEEAKTSEEDLLSALDSFSKDNDTANRRSKHSENSAGRGKKKSIFSGLFSREKNESEEPEYYDEPEDIETEDVPVINEESPLDTGRKHDVVREFTDELHRKARLDDNTDLFNDIDADINATANKHKQTVKEVDEEYKQRRAEKIRIRDLFTPPAEPEPPKFSVKEKEEKKREKFTPPADNGEFSYYDDEMFSRFEDDKVFAGLHDEENKKKYNF